MHHSLVEVEDFLVEVVRVWQWVVMEDFYLAVVVIEGLLPVLVGEHCHSESAHFETQH